MTYNVSSGTLSVHWLTMLVLFVDSEYTEVLKKRREAEALQSNVDEQAEVSEGE